MLIEDRFAAVNLDKNAAGPEYAKVVEALAADDLPRTDFLKACLKKLGLQVSQNTTTVPSLSSLHVSAQDPADVSRMVASIRDDVVTKDGRQEYLKDENDTFRVETSDEWNMGALRAALPDSSDAVSEGIVDYNAIVKHLVLHEELPSSKLTPYFNHHAYYSNLRRYQSQAREGKGEFGSNIMYGEVLTSTNTILEK